LIVVTGADGIVGRAICVALKDAGQNVIPVVHRRRSETAPDAYVLDLADNQAFRVLEGKGVDTIIHLAAAVPHSSYYQDTEHSAELTRAIDRNVLILRESVGAQVVYMSTCGFYNRETLDVKFENDSSNVRVTSPYFSAKYAGEKLFGQESDSVIMRLAAPIGPGLKASVVLNKFIKAVRSGQPITLWGTGGREQNFVDVRDVAELVCRVIANPQGCLINVASKRPSTMLELANTLIEVMGEGEIGFSNKADPKDGETARYSIAAAFELFGWEPMFSLEDSCRFVLRGKIE